MLLFRTAVNCVSPSSYGGFFRIDRLEKLERAVEQLQKRNTELEAEVRSLKKQTAAVPDGKFKTKITQDGKTYVHTWSDFRSANPEFGDDQFDEVIGRMQLMF